MGAVAPASSPHRDHFSPHADTNGDFTYTRQPFVWPGMPPGWLLRQTVVASRRRSGPLGERGQYHEFVRPPRSTKKGTVRTPLVRTAAGPDCSAQQTHGPAPGSLTRHPWCHRPPAFRVPGRLPGRPPFRNQCSRVKPCRSVLASAIGAGPDPRLRTAKPLSAFVLPHVPIGSIRWAVRFPFLTAIIQRLE